ncbi:MAG: hypothetical protein R2747_17080 [Pyrinomonadaceae bacterium]
MSPQSGQKTSKTARVRELSALSPRNDDMGKNIGLSCLGFLFIFFILSKTTYSQTVIVDSRQTSLCEFTAASFSGIAQHVPSDKTIIVIAYKGENETKENIAERRLHNAKVYLTKFYEGTNFSRSPEKVITAVGIGQFKEGKLDFYVDGNLIYTFLFRDNRDFNVALCHGDFYKDRCKDKLSKLFYPCFGEIKEPRKKD